ncbi:hypothetical protein GM418_08710 [Maribellus comscasis]|uniref:Adhesin domain-containing protein n=1 Tax=Maribellus comscasis TaxID=2681766 RepID=A0A6I6JLK0_9BACT|nr:hypothetical protein [Maribellus comscasis]QGY43735.1 hypothetical protein GM418_08710 [Maribellus comscasis]
MRQYLFLIVALTASLAAKAQQHKETINKEIVFPESTDAVLIIENIFGNIDVQGYSGNKVVLTIENEFSADTKEELVEAMQKVFLALETRNDTVDIFLDGICGCHRNKNINQNWNLCDFDFRYDFKVKVPSRANINVSTVNDGEITIENVTGEVVARNVNGGITEKNVSGPTNVHAINGNVDVRYAKNPVKKSTYYSLNGDVNIYYNTSLSADMHFKSFQGDMYTDFDISEWLPPILTSSTSKNKRGTSFRIENKTAVRIGKGGVILEFETFNGDVYIRKI